MIYVAIVLAALSLLALHGWLSRRRTPWFGAVLPVLWLASVAWALTTGLVQAPRDYLLAVAGLAILLSVWAEGRERVTGSVRPGAGEPYPTDPVS